LFVRGKFGITVYFVAEADPCVPNPCMNNAQCRPVIGGFTCSPCPINVTGALCELGMSDAHAQ